MIKGVVLHHSAKRMIPSLQHHTNSMYGSKPRPTLQVEEQKVINYLDFHNSCDFGGRGGSGELPL